MPRLAVETSAIINPTNLRLKPQLPSILIPLPSPKHKTLTTNGALIHPDPKPSVRIPLPNSPGPLLTNPQRQNSSRKMVRTLQRKPPSLPTHPPLTPPQDEEKIKLKGEVPPPPSPPPPNPTLSHQNPPGPPPHRPPRPKAPIKLRRIPLPKNSLPPLRRPLLLRLRRRQRQRVGVSGGYPFFRGGAG